MRHTLKEDAVIAAIWKSIGDMRQREWCRLHGVNETVLSEVVNRSRAPTELLCAIVGVEKTTSTVTTYRRMKV